MRFDVSFLPALAAAYLLAFARVGTMVMLLPGIGEMNVPARVRLTMALILTAILLPGHQQAYAIDLKAYGPVLTMLFEELAVGAVLGLTARLAISALQVAGTVVAQQLGLGFVSAVDSAVGCFSEYLLIGDVALGLHDTDEPVVILVNRRLKDRAFVRRHFSERRSDVLMRLALDGVGLRCCEQVARLMIADGRGLAFAAFDLRPFDTFDGVMGDGVFLAQIFEQ